MTMKKCKVCGEEFKPKTSEKLCSNKCKDKQRYLNTLRPCSHCSKLFLRKGNTKFCSTECRFEYYKELNDNISHCVICDKELQLKSIKRKFKACNGACGATLTKINQTPQSKETQNKKLSQTYHNKTDEEKTAIRNKISLAHRNKTDEEKQQSLLKYQTTSIQKYGVPNPSQNPLIKQKWANTNLKRYNCECVLSSQKFRDKAKKTSYKKYNKESFSQTEDFIIQILDRKRYELKHKAKLSNIQTALLKGLETFSNEEILENRKHLHDEEYIIKHCYTNGHYDQFKFYTHFVLSNKKELEYRQALGLKVHNNFSLAEKCVLKYLKECYPCFTYEENNKSIIKNPKTNRYFELDIVVYKDKSILCAVEYNGVYWHDKNNPHREVLKTNLCSAKNIPLFHIWEDTEIEDLGIILDYLNNVC